MLEFFIKDVICEKPKLIQFPSCGVAEFFFMENFREKIVKKHADIKDVKYLQWVWYSPKYSKELNYLQQKASCSNAYIVFFSKLIKNMVMAEVYLRNDIRGNVEYEKFVLPSKRYKRPYYAYLFFVSKRGKVKKFYKYEEGYIK